MAGIMQAIVALGTAKYFFHIGHPIVYRRRLKSSEIFVKSLYTTESLLSDALRTKYKVLIDGDGLLSVYSYENSPYIQSVVIGTRTRVQKGEAIVGSAILMVLSLFVLLVMVRCGGVNSSSIMGAVGKIFTISCIFLGIYLLKSSFKKKAGGATVYFNATEENWVTSSELSLFNLSDKIEVAIKWSGEVFSEVVNNLLFGGGALSIIFYEGDRRKEYKPGMGAIISSGISYCVHIASLLIFVWCKRGTVPVVEVQFAQAVSEKDADNANANADILKFDAGKVARRFANDIAKEFGKRWTARAGVYYDFAIAGEHGGLVYGRMRAGGPPANV
ncbi:uncharacterized protein V1513DRAFT_455031 [Lipomyces chichibuensis]|uniref:uncharacterized protein n=1 Tax=Lipomyces chichibuensis TaxID=1546026 RepID=UPI00334422F7